MAPDIDRLRAELAALEARHDALYQYSDDYSVYVQGRAEAARIASLRAALAALEAA